MDSQKLVAELHVYLASSVDQKLKQLLASIVEHITKMEDDNCCCKCRAYDRMRPLK